jgi:hypothetical protein
LAGEDETGGTTAKRADFVSRFHTRISPARMCRVSTMYTDSKIVLSSGNKSVSAQQGKQQQRVAGGQVSQGVMQHSAALSVLEMVTERHGHFRPSRSACVAGCLAVAISHCLRLTNSPSLHCLLQCRIDRVIDRAQFSKLPSYVRSDFVEENLHLQRPVDSKSHCEPPPRRSQPLF